MKRDGLFREQNQEGILTKGAGWAEVGHKWYVEWLRRNLGTGSRCRYTDYYAFCILVPLTRRRIHRCGLAFRILSEIYMESQFT